MKVDPLSRYFAVIINNCFNRKQAFCFALEKMIMSSANVRKGIVILFFMMGNPILLLELLSNCNFLASTSTQRITKKGERGSPCLSPRCG